MITSSCVIVYLSCHDIRTRLCIYNWLVYANCENKTNQLNVWRGESSNKLLRSTQSTCNLLCVCWMYACYKINMFKPIKCLLYTYLLYLLVTCFVLITRQHHNWIYHCTRVNNLKNVWLNYFKSVYSFDEINGMISFLHFNCKLMDDNVR